MVFLTATISLWVRTAVFVLAAAGKTAVALKTRTTKTTAAARKRRNMVEGYSACLMARSRRSPSGSMLKAVGIVDCASVADA
jgi:hypothetical protein